jgi:hypothetical protein
LGLWKKGWAMAGERREATFQQLLDEGMLEIGDGYRAQNNELGGTGPIFLRAGHVTDSHIDFVGVEHFHEHLADKVRSKMSKVGDDTVMIRKAWECHPKAESRLGTKPKAVRVTKSKVGYETIQGKVTEQWPRLREELSEAGRFSKDFVSCLGIP